MDVTKRLANKKVLVIGGAYATGLGYAAMSRCVQEGAEVASIDIAASTANQDGPKLKIVKEVQADMSDETQAERAISEAAKALGGIDAIINTVGLQRSGAVDEISLDDWDDVLRVNVRSVFLAARYGLPYLRESKGCIVNTSSAAAFAGVPALSAYTASKGAVIAFSRSLAMELAPAGIRVNVVNPGFVATPFNSPIVGRMGGDEVAEEFVKSTVPMGRPALPSEIAGVYAFLVSEDASFMTGQLVTADGGTIS